MNRLRRVLNRLAGYGLVGMVNTIISLAIITGLDLGLGAPPAVANAVGFGVGMVVSYGLNRRFVFKHDASVPATGPRFAIAVGCGFLLNQGVLQAALAVLGHGALNHVAAQIFAMGVYTVSVFLACQFWVFRSPPTHS